MESVNRWLARVPEPVMRLDLEGVEGAQRHRAIEQWYAQEIKMLQSQTPAPEGEALARLNKQLDEIARQRAVLLSE